MTTPEKLNGFLVGSIALHAAFFAVVLFAPNVFPMSTTETWGSAKAGDGMNVNIVGSMSGIALPAPEVTADNPANESAGFYKSEPAPPTPRTVEKAEPIPGKVTKTPPKKSAAPPNKKSSPPAPTTPENAVPYGKGGNPALGYGQSTTQTGPVGADFGDGGAFGTKYSNYVNVMNRKISQNWLKGLVNSTQVSGTPRVYLSFDIDRNGNISNIEIKLSSNIPALDNSAKRALFASSPLLPLPADYSGSKVSVNIYFEYLK